MSRFISRLLCEDDDVQQFESGVALLDNWFTTQAVRAHKTGICAVTVWIDSEIGQICGYFAISPTQAVKEVDSLPRSLNSGFSTVPGYRIGRLALASYLQQQGLGKQLLLDAIRTAIAASEIAGGRLIIIDPIDQQVAAWYDRIGFVPTKDDSEKPAPRYLTIADAKRTLAEVR